MIMNQSSPSYCKLIAISFAIISVLPAFAQKYVVNTVNSDTTFNREGVPKFLEKNVLNLGFFSPLNHHISLEYNRLFNNKFMFVLQGAIINSNIAPTSTSISSNFLEGGYGEVGVKIFFNYEYTQVGKHDYYQIQGIYFKPQAVLSIFQTTSTTAGLIPGQTITDQYMSYGAALVACIGGDYILAHCLVLGGYVGVGCSFINSGVNNSVSNYYSYLIANPSFPLVISGGATIGFPF
jgi:hypothetical protein